MSDQTYHHNTTDIASGEQFSYWRDAICNAYVPLEPERAHACSFRGSIDGLLLPELHGSMITAQSHLVRLSKSGLAARSQSPFYANLMCAGQAQVTQYGKCMTADPGDVYVVDCESAWDVDFRTDFRMFCIEIPQEVLRPQLGRQGQLITPVLKGDTGVGRILANYMQLISQLPAPELQHVQSLMVEHCSELLARAQRFSADGAEGAARVRHDMFERIVSLIKRRLADPDLTPASASAELGISRSYLFKILAEHGQSFSAYVRDCRLEQCHRAIQDEPRRTIADIASTWGFQEMSTFARAYRARYGCAPRQGARDD